MKTKNMTLFAIAFTFALVITNSAVKAIVPQVNVCAQQMVYDMRNCGQQEVRVQKPDTKTVFTRTAPNTAAPSKSAESVQGVPVDPSCNQIAYWTYQRCTGIDQAPGGEQDKDTKPNNSVAPTTNDK